MKLLVTAALTAILFGCPDRAWAVAFGDTVTCSGTGISCSSSTAVVTANPAGVDSASEFTLNYFGSSQATTQIFLNFEVDYLEIRFFNFFGETIGNNVSVELKDISNPITYATLTQSGLGGFA